MIHFRNHWLLLLSLAVPVLVWLWLRQRRSAFTYPDTGMFLGLPAGRSQAAKRGGALLRALVLLLVVVALAGPRFADWRSRVPTEGIAIEIAVDVSGSMAARDFLWNNEPISRLDAARRALRLFLAGGEGPSGERLPGRPNDLVGLVTFATRPQSTCPLTLSHSVLLDMLDAEEPRSLPGESETNLSDAVADSLDRLTHAGTKRKVLILISDGEHNVPQPASGWTPRQPAQLAATLHIPIYTIDAGGDLDAADAAVGPSDPKDRAQIRERASQTLRKLAEFTSGKYFQARATEQLLAVCQEIDRLEKNELQSFQYRRYHEGYTWFGLAALALGVILQLLEMTVWQRLP